MSTEEYIRQLQNEIKRLDGVVKFYESIILDNPELRGKLSEVKKYYGNKDRRKKR